MTEKILYIFGAGASVNSFPLARSVYNVSGDLVIPGLAHEMKNFNFAHYFENIQGEQNIEFIQHLKLNFQQIAQEADNFGDVDTYAKYLHLKNPGGNELKNLKNMLSAFFILKQILLKDRDKRYLSWLVSIMDEKRFPQNIKILSWNYDFQIEMAGSSIGSLEGISHSSSSFIYSPSWLNHYPNLDPTFQDYKDLSLVHLNGIAGYISDGEFYKNSVFNESTIDDAEKLLVFMRKNKLNSMVHFVWEKSGYHDVLKKVNELISDISIVVVIGYSFPFFNREVDKRVFELLITGNKLKKIYFQNPVLDGTQLKSQFGLPDTVEIIHITNTENFHIPFEY